MSKTIYVQRGEAKDIYFKAINSSGGVIDITSKTVNAIFKENNFDGSTAFSKSSAVVGEITKVSATDGLFIISLESTDTMTLDGTNYYFIITVDTSTIEQGYLVIYQEADTSVTTSGVYIYTPNITLTGTIDGTNKTFVFPNEIKANSEDIYFGNLHLNRDVDYTISGQTVTLNTAPVSPEIITATAEVLQ